MAVSQAELDELFASLNIWDKIGEGRLSDDCILAARRPSWDYENGVSDIVRHHNALGYHVATSHRITMPDGTAPHWDAKDLRVGEVIVYAT